MATKRRAINSRQVADQTDQGDLNTNSTSDNATVKCKNEKPSEVLHQDQPSPFKWPAVMYHFSMSVFYALLLYYGITLMTGVGHIIDPDGVIPAYGGRFKFLTHINQWLQLGFFTLQFITDLVPISSVKRNLQKLCDLFFTTVAVPTSLFIAVTFWGIYAIDRNLIYPERFDLVVPQYLNHFWHTTIAVWVVFETLICFHHYPTTGTAAAVNFAFNAAYLSWVVWIYLKTDFWVYPILKVLPLPFFALFNGGCMFFGLTMYLVGKAVAQWRWGQILYID